MYGYEVTDLFPIDMYGYCLPSYPGARRAGAEKERMRVICHGIPWVPCTYVYVRILMTSRTSNPRAMAVYLFFTCTETSYLLISLPFEHCVFRECCVTVAIVTSCTWNSTETVVLRHRNVSVKIRVQEVATATVAMYSRNSE